MKSKAVTVPDYPSSKGTPVVTVDNPSTLQMVKRLERLQYRQR